MMNQVTFTIDDPGGTDLFDEVGYGDHVLVSFNSATACVVNNIETLSEYVLAGVYIRRVDPPFHVLIHSWKDWGSTQPLRLEPGWTLELDVAWMGVASPDGDRVAVATLEEG